MGWRRLAIAPLLSASAALLFVADLRASTFVAVPFDALVRESSAAAFVTPMSARSVWENDRIVTYTDAHVDEQIAGAPLGEEVWVRTLGGQVGDLGQAVSGEAVLTVGRPSLIFVRPAYVLGAGSDGGGIVEGAYTVTERAQGQFPVVLDAHKELRVHRSSAVGAALTPQGGEPTTLAGELLHGMNVHDVTTTVSAAWPRIHAP